MGFCAYYRRFVCDFSDIANPLHPLTENSKRYAWNETFQVNFAKLKFAFWTNPVLSYLKRGCRFVVETDASLSGMGGILYKETNISADLNKSTVIEKRIVSYSKDYRKWVIYFS